MHFTPTSASWVNMIERFFLDIPTERLRRRVFTSVAELIAAIDEYIADHDNNPKAFIWPKSARYILQKVIRANSLTCQTECNTTLDDVVRPECPLIKGLRMDTVSRIKKADA